MKYYIEAKAPDGTKALYHLDFLTAAITSVTMLEITICDCHQRLSELLAVVEVGQNFFLLTMPL